MRATLLLPLVALALISSAAAQNERNGQSPLNCQNCWGEGRINLEACKSLSKEDMEKLGTMTDAEVAEIGDNHDLAPIKACLCDLAAQTDDILQSCSDSCPPEMAEGLQAEANIVDKGVCNVPSKPKLESENPDNSTSGEGQDAAGSEDNSATDDPEKSNSDDNNNKPSEGGASSVQWSGALLTVVAVMVSAVAF